MIELKIKHSLIEELKMSLELLRNPKEYESLRRVDWPTIRSLYRSLACGGKEVNLLRNSCSVPQGEWEKVFSREGLSLQGPVTCYIHFIGPEGKYNPDKNEIHVNCNYGIENELESVLHELLHLVTYETSLSCEEREARVEEIGKKYAIEV